MRRQPDPEETPVSTAVAMNLRALRQQRRLSLQRLATMASVSRSMIGQIERRLTVPTINVILRLARALDVDLASLIGAPAIRKPQMLRAVEQIVRSTGPGEVVVTALTPRGRASHSRLYRIELGACRFAVAARVDHVGTTACVLNGRIAIEVENETHLLEAGDAIVIRTGVAHAYSNPDRTEAVLCVVLVGGTIEDDWPMIDPVVQCCGGQFQNDDASTPSSMPRNIVGGNEIPWHPRKVVVSVMADKGDPAT